MTTTTNVIRDCFLGGITAVAIITFPVAADMPGIPTRPYPEINIERFSTLLAQNYSLPESFYSDPHYSAEHGLPELMGEHIELIHKFVSELLIQTKDIDPQFSKIVDDHFWELV